MSKYDGDKRIVLYPHYITAGKTVAEGRRIPKELACDNPNVLEMLECCKELQLPAIIEDKHYPRDWFIRCRLRVKLRNDDPERTLVNPAIPDRRTLLLKIAELQPKHKPPLPQPGAVVAAPVATEAAGTSSAGSKAQAGGKASKKKKGK